MDVDDLRRVGVDNHRLLTLLHLLLMMMMLIRRLVNGVGFLADPERGRACAVDLDDLFGAHGDKLGLDRNEDSLSFFFFLLQRQAKEKRGCESIYKIKLKLKRKGKPAFLTVDK